MDKVGIGVVERLYNSGMDSTGARMPILATVAVLVIAAAVAAYVVYRPAPAPAPAQDAAAPTLDSGPDVSAEVSGAVQSPAEQLPETNPFSGYKNPFQ